MALHELIPGLLMALDEHRSQDAYDLAGAVVEEVGSPEMAVLHVALAANMLHALPGMPLRMLAITLRGETTNDDRTDGQIAAGLLDAFAEGLDGPGSLSEQSEQFLSEFDMRPGSTALIKMLLSITQLVLSDFEMRAGLKMASPVDAANLRRQSIKYARSRISSP